MKNTLTESVLEYKGCTLHYWLSGEESAPLLVFSHGAYVDHNEWAATFPLALEKGVPRSHMGYEGTWSLAAGKFLHAPIGRGSHGHPGSHSSITGDFHWSLHGRKPATGTRFPASETVKSMVILDSTWNFQKLSRLEDGR
jgi:hypothetical protein